MCGLQIKLASGVSYLQRIFTKIVQYVSSLVWDCSWVLTAIIFISILFSKKMTSQLLLCHKRRKFLPNLNTLFQNVVYSIIMETCVILLSPKLEHLLPSDYYIIHLFLLLFSPNKRSTENTYFYYCKKLFLVKMRSYLIPQVPWHPLSWKSSPNWWTVDLVIWPVDFIAQIKLLSRHLLFLFASELGSSKKHAAFKTSI